MRKNLLRLPFLLSSPLACIKLPHKPHQVLLKTAHHIIFTQMSLTHKRTQVSPFPNPNPRKTPKPFDETLIRRLTALLASLSASPAAAPLSSLTLAVELLSASLTSFSLLLSDPALPISEADAAALSSHLDAASAALLCSANSLSSLLDRFSRLRLHLAFALHLLSRRPPTPDLTRKARDSVAEWRDNLRIDSGEENPSSFGLTPGEAPRGRASAVQRAIYAVEAVSALVIGLVSSYLGARTDLSKIRVSSEFSWSAAFYSALTVIKGKKAGSFAAEIEAVDSSVKKLMAVLDHDDEITKEVRSMTEEAKKKTEELTEGLDRLGNAVDELFRAGLCARNAALQGFRIGPKKCK